MLTLALPVPLLRDVPGEHAIGLIGVNPEGLGQVGVERCAVGSDSRLQYRITGPLAPSGPAGREIVLS